MDVAIHDAGDVLRDVLERARTTGDRGHLPFFVADAVTILHRLGDDESAARISAHIETATYDRDEAEQLDATLTELKAALGSRFDSIVRSSEFTSINDVLAYAITALDNVST
jgi:hypothetical protein